jgi:hypothetical protein
VIVVCDAAEKPRSIEKCSVSIMCKGKIGYAK